MSSSGQPALQAASREAGLRPLRVEHFMAALVLPRVASRLAGFGLHQQAGKLSPLSVIPVVNELACATLELERWPTRGLRAPFGTSLLAIAVKD